jgi:hypothetical protein
LRTSSRFITGSFDREDPVGATAAGLRASGITGHFFVKHLEPRTV